MRTFCGFLMLSVHGIMKTGPIYYVLLLFLFVSCGREIAETPKPTGYPRIHFPEHSYRSWDSGCAYKLEIPRYTSMDLKEDYTTNPCWYNLDFKPFDATLHITYHPVHDLIQLDSLHADSRRFAFKHTIKAEDILEIPIANKDRSASGFLYDIRGNTATNYNFYLTDSARHFFRGSLYFNSKTNPDSVAPVLQFIRKDLDHLIQNFRWN